MKTPDLSYTYSVRTQIGPIPSSGMGGGASTSALAMYAGITNAKYLLDVDSKRTVAVVSVEAVCKACGGSGTVNVGRRSRPCRHVHPLGWTFDHCHTVIQCTFDRESLQDPNPLQRRIEREREERKVTCVACDSRFDPPAPHVLVKDRCPDCVADAIAHGREYETVEATLAKVCELTGLNEPTPDMRRIVAAYFPT